MLLHGKLFNHFKQTFVLLETVLLILRHYCTIVSLCVKLRLGVVALREHSVGKWRESHKTHAKFLAHGEKTLMPACHHRIAVLHGGNWANPVCTSQIILCCFRNAPMQNFAFSYKRSHCISHFFGFNVLVNAVLVVEVDVVGAKTTQRTFNSSSDYLWT